MASASVYYKFKSQKEPSRITFDGPGISVWDLKREIILQNRMGKGTDFNLGLYNSDTGDEYRDDSTLIPRSSQVIVRRLPPPAPGKGTAAIYVADAIDTSTSSGRGGSNMGPNASGGPPARTGGFNRGPMAMRFDGKDDGQGSKTTQTMAPSEIPSSITAQNPEEAQQIAAMFAASSQAWDDTQDRMSQATFRHRPPIASRGGFAPRGGGRGGGPTAVYERQASQDKRSEYQRDPPPPTYICYRCGKKGHWIQECPTNDDRAFDDRPRFMRTTGIPKSMLKTIELAPDDERKAGVMVTADGDYVIAQADTASWERNRQRVRPLTADDVYASVPADPTLTCTICGNLVKDAVLTPCCSSRACEECIHTHLTEHEFACPDCDKRITDLLTLKRDDESRSKAQKYVEEALRKHEMAGTAATEDNDGPGDPDNSRAGEEKLVQRVSTPTTEEQPRGDSAAPSETVSTNGKPRPAGLPMRPIDVINSADAMSTPPGTPGEASSDSAGKSAKPSGLGEEIASMDLQNLQPSTGVLQQMIQNLLFMLASPSVGQPLKDQLGMQLQWCQANLAIQFQQHQQALQMQQLMQMGQMGMNMGYGMGMGLGIGYGYPTGSAPGMQQMSAPSALPPLSLSLQGFGPAGPSQQQQAEMWAVNSSERDAAYIHAPVANAGRNVRVPLPKREREQDAVEVNMLAANKAQRTE